MGKTAASFVNVIAVGLSIVWLVVGFLPGRWHYEDVALFYKFDVGLYSVKVEPSVGSAVLAQGASWLSHGVGMGAKFDALKGSFPKDVVEGHKWIGDVSERFCGLSMIPGIADDMCYMWKTTQYSGWTTLALICLGVLFLWLGAGFNFYFWNSKVTEMGGRWVVIFFWLAPLCFIIGVAQYGTLTSNFSVITFFSSSSVSTFDFSFFVAMTLSGLSIIPALVTVLCSDMGRELDAKIDGKEAAIARYGAMEVGGAGVAQGQYGGAQPAAGFAQYGATAQPYGGGAAFGGAMPSQPPPSAALPPAVIAAGAAGDTADKYVVVAAPAPPPGSGVAAW